MAPWHKEDMTFGMYITLFGVLLLFLKLIGVPVVLGYFFILCIIFWPATLIITVASLFIAFLSFEWVKEKFINTLRH